MKILAVDDDPFILELLTMMTVRAGFNDISTASSGKIALDMLSESNAVFDCLLLDIKMPEIDGIELCRRIRAMPGYRKTPIIMLTAMIERDYIDSAFRAGATDYANKPFDMVELSNRLLMAEELVIGRQMAAVIGARSKETQSSGEGTHQLDLHDEVLIKGLNSLIGYTALSNYLIQLTRAGIACSQVIAIKIGGIEDIVSRALTEELFSVLAKVAVAVDDALRTNGYMMAFSGNGTFIVVLEKVTLEASIALEAEIQNLIDRRHTKYSSGDLINIKISIGNPLRPSASKTQRIRRTFDRAIARAEIRLMRKQIQPKHRSSRLVDE